MAKTKNSRLSKHIWCIGGLNKAKFPEGNALFIKTPNHRVLIDTNPGINIIEKALNDEMNLKCADITEILLTHTHLDHGRSLADIYEESKARIYAHKDTLTRCEKTKKIGLYAGIPKEFIHHFEEFGTSIGFKNKKYPAYSKIPLSDQVKIEFDDVTIIPHEVFGHAPNIFYFEIKDSQIINQNSKGQNNNEYSIILSGDYDFTPIPWYGIPQRGDSVELFKNDTIEIVNKKPNCLISSHRIDLIYQNYIYSELKKFLNIINDRTNRITQLLSSNKQYKLKEIPDFVYPVKKMKGKFSNNYIYCAQIWDNWLKLAHLEVAWKEGKVICTDSANDEYLQKSIENKNPIERTTNEKKGLLWASKTMNEESPYEIPLDSKWKLVER
ncbi:MAG: MBL fold metallo-hydrolase [Promethearchaeota archaeon]